MNFLIAVVEGYSFKQMLVPKALWGLKCPYKMEALLITVHETDSDASAEEYAREMIQSPLQSSFHLVVDESYVIQTIYLDNTSFHVKGGANTAANRFSISLYITRSLSGGPNYEAAKDNAARYIAQLLNAKDIGLENVRMHNQWDATNCPARIRAEGQWAPFLTSVMKYQNYYKAAGTEDGLQLQFE